MFDPSLSYFELNWLSLFVPISVIFLTFFNLRGVVSFLQLLVSFIYRVLVKGLFGKEITFYFFFGLFVVLLTFNFRSLIPFIFPISSQLIMVVPLSLFFWSLSNFFSWLNSFLFNVKSLLPQSTPYFLIPFMVVIEFTSLLIRPVTLSVRLVANITAGHLLLSILVIFVTQSSFYLYVVVVLINVLEVGVSFIQAYVFFTLVRMYTTEV